MFDPLTWLGKLPLRTEIDEGRPVERVSKAWILHHAERRGACCCRGSLATYVVLIERAHVLRRGGVRDGPETPHHVVRSGEQKRFRQSQRKLSAILFSKGTLAGPQYNCICLQLQIHDIAQGEGRRA